MLNPEVIKSMPGKFFALVDLTDQLLHGNSLTRGVKFGMEVDRLLLIELRLSLLIQYSTAYFDKKICLIKL